jgi:ribonuclease P protein component
MIMLSKRYRLTEESDFQKVKKHGKVFKHDYFILSVLDTKKDRLPRFGFIVSSKISPNSSFRHSVSRALTEGVRFNIYKIKNGYDMVFVARSTIAKKYTTEIMKAVEKAIDNSGATK